MAEEAQDLNKEEEKTSTGKDQPEKETPKSPKVGEEGAVSTDKSEDDEVSISKSELERLRKEAEEKDNYRKAVIRLNRERGRILPGSEPEEPAKKAEEEFDEYGELIKKQREEFLTKKEFEQAEEQRAINKACEDEEIALNWPDVIAFYVPPRSKSYDAKVQAIADAHRRWKADQGITPAPVEDKGKKDTAELATDKGISKGKEKQPTPPKKHIFPHREKMEDWY
jgi:hypothetical protein